MRGLIPLFVLVAGVLFGGCAVHGDADRAAQDGARFLRDAFVEHRYDAAAQQSVSLDAAGLRIIVDGTERQMGRVVGARPMSAAPALERGRLFVWYRVLAERGAGNVGLLVKGDARRGYVVESLHVDAKDAPERWPGRPVVAFR